MSDDRTAESPGQRVLSMWRRLTPFPAGRWLFSRLLGRMVPYTDTIRARVLELEPGVCTVELRDRRRIRNHLRSVHAVALVNLGEMSSGLAMLTCLPPTVRGIVRGLEADYVKKARGRLEARCETALPDSFGDEPHVVQSTISDASGDVVARISVHWLLSPR